LGESILIITKDNGGFVCFGKVLGKMFLSFSPSRKEAISFFKELVEQMKKEANKNEYKRVG
jgi:hypothetical protein